VEGGGVTPMDHIAGRICLQFASNLCPTLPPNLPPLGLHFAPNLPSFCLQFTSNSPPFYLHGSSCRPSTCSSYASWKQLSVSLTSRGQGVRRPCKPGEVLRGFTLFKGCFQAVFRLFSGLFSGCFQAVSTPIHSVLTPINAVQNPSSALGSPSCYAAGIAPRASFTTTMECGINFPLWCPYNRIRL